MDAKGYAAVTATALVLLIGSLVLLSPPFEGLRETLGLPKHLPGARYNETVGAAEIISEEGGEDYLGRIALMYHSVFSLLILATMLPLIHVYGLGDDLPPLYLTGAFLTILGGIGYGYFVEHFFLHGVFILGLATLFVSGLLTVARMRVRTSSLLDSVILTNGILLLVGAVIGGYLGSSFMSERWSFLEALIASRFNPDLAEENLLWRALTAHEHAMIMLAVILAFLVAVRVADLREGRIAKTGLLILQISQILAAVGSYLVWPIGKMAHLIITPSALAAVAAATMLSLALRDRFLRGTLLLGNLVVWLGVNVHGVVVAVSLRKPRFFPPAFRDPAWDWAELAYNIGHWHILLGLWGIVLLLVYLKWPIDLLDSRIARAGGWLTMVGFSLAALTLNLYMLANPPGMYSPNPYGNFWLSTFVEPSLALMSLGIAVSYIHMMVRWLRG